MPANYARYLVGRHRSVHANRQLGWTLAFVAGAINAGGFLAVHQYTSHVTGTVSSLADNLALGHLDLVVDGVVGVLSFLAGAMCCAVMVNFARRRQLSSEFALPLMPGTPGEGGARGRPTLERVTVLGGLLLAFTGGGVIGAYGFKFVGYVSTVPLAVLLAVLALVPAWDDPRSRGARTSG